MPRIVDRDHSRPVARKRFGQHFLEPVWADKVVAAIKPGPDDTFIEIGPGPGAITRPLTARARQVLAFEIDRDLAARLRAAAPANLHLVEGDFLNVTPESCREALATLSGPVTSLRVAGNLPYNVASPILFKLVELFDGGLPLTDAAVMLQREVANRLLAAPGTKDYGVLTILIGHHCDVGRLLQLPAGAFRPAPKVQSTVVRLCFRPPVPPVQRPALFAGLVQAVFSRRRKTLANAMLAYPPAAAAGPDDVLRRVGIDGQRRPETLSIAEMAGLADGLSQLLPITSGTPDRAVL